MRSIFFKETLEMSSSNSTQSSIGLRSAIFWPIDNSNQIIFVRASASTAGISGWGVVGPGRVGSVEAMVSSDMFIGQFGREICFSSSLSKSTVLVWKPSTIGSLTTEGTLERGLYALQTNQKILRDFELDGIF